MCHVCLGQDSVSLTSGSICLPGAGFCVTLTSVSICLPGGMMSYVVQWINCQYACCMHACVTLTSGSICLPGTGLCYIDQWVNMSARGRIVLH